MASQSEENTFMDLTSCYKTVLIYNIHPGCIEMVYERCKDVAEYRERFKRNGFLLEVIEDSTDDTYKVYLNHRDYRAKIGIMVFPKDAITVDEILEEIESQFAQEATRKLTHDESNDYEEGDIQLHITTFLKILLMLSENFK